MNEQSARQSKWVVCFLLGVVVLASFWPALGCGFVAYDDGDYVTLNKEIQHGWNWHSLQWALTTGHAANWHPLTWMSHMLDWQVYGLNPAGHHFTNLLLHTASSILLFLLLDRLTGAQWRSAFVAAIFALHPLRVESVVWIAERKDVLSTFLWMLTAGCYVLYANKTGEHSARRKVFYGLSLLSFALGLMSKPMLVTLPCVLLLLDFWPLARWKFGSKFPARLIMEKLPFFFMSAGDSATTFLLQKHLGLVEPLATFSLGSRLANIPVAYVSYIRKIFWPSGLAVFYPGRPLSLLEVSSSLFFLLAITFVAARPWRTKPYLIVGWLWFLGMLFPTIGLVQVSTQAMADRYSYLPSVGLWIMVAWGVGDCLGENPIWRKILPLAAGASLLACIVLTRMQIPYWQNSLALFQRAANVTERNYLAYFNLGYYARDRGEYNQAILYFKKAMSAEVDCFPNVNQAHAYNNLGYTYLQAKDITNAVADFEKAVDLQPIYPEAYYNLGCAFQANNQPDVAVEAFQRALALDPNVAEIRFKMGNALLQLGKPAEAIAQYSQALQINPGLDDAANNLAWLLATCPDHSLRDGAKAVALARRASDHAHNQNPVILGTLAAAYAEVGQFSEAAAMAQQASQLALAQKNSALASALESQGRRYQSGLGGSPP